MGQSLSHSFPPPPLLTRENLADQTGKVFIVTGCTSGIGKSLTGILYSANAKVYMAARSHEKATIIASELRANHPESKGQLAHLHLDLNDLSTIRKSANDFLAQEDKLHVLFNNAGIMAPPEGIKTIQGYEPQLGINAIAPFLFTTLLMPVLLSTAKISAAGDVRIIWLSSSFAGYFAPNGGVAMDNLDYQIKRNQWIKYGISKAANTLYSAECARRYGQDGIISISLDPGVLKTELLRNTGWLRLAVKLIEHDPIYGAYTELFGAFSPELTLDRNNAFIGPWGRIEPLRRDIDMACRTVEEGGTGNAKDFWEWTEQQVRDYT
ncbi:retinol dehydrogenase 12 [Whalleya microplaca]|nr:retinol dehydrogenase 12 [Whalleya microplaca]